MPQRFLRPGLTTSQRYNRCSWQAQNLFVRLMTLVDDHGRYDAEPRLLRSHAFPFGDPRGKEVSLMALADWCLELAKSGLCLFYKDDQGKRYLQLLRWQERVRSSSRYPDPSDNKCQQMSADVGEMLPPKPLAISHSHKPLAISHSIGGSDQQNTPTPAADNEIVWREKIAAEPAYRHINVPDEFRKMVRWCEVNKKQPTRKRFINWLNRIEKPMRPFVGNRKTKPPPKTPHTEPPPDETQWNPEKIAERQRQVRELSEKLARQTHA